jgi:hypothetical protein
MPDDKMEVLDHIARESPPWARDHFTECGRNVKDVKSFISRQECVTKIARIGKQRAAFSTCMVCAQRSHPAETWDDWPIGIVARYCTRNHYYGYGNRRKNDSDGARIENELRSLALLVDAHQDEYDAALEAIEGMSSLADARAAKAKEARVR